ncbi:hypothetical protein KSF73_04355 [Burkholderiaceae bacterium DAT-1]|nr:hypothetical protein [Burkholderiaceae bacterium DAT-1]
MTALLIAFPLVGLVVLDALAVRLYRAHPARRYGQFYQSSLFAAVAVSVCGLISLGMDTLFPSQTKDSGVLSAMVLLLVGTGFVSYTWPKWKITARAVAIATALSLAPLHDPGLALVWHQKILLIVGMAAALPLIARQFVRIGMRLDTRLPEGTGWRDVKRTFVLAAMLGLVLYHLSRHLH